MELMCWIANLTHEVRRLDDGSYMTTIDHDGHDDECGQCAQCDAEMAALRKSLPSGWEAEWTGEGSGATLDVHIYRVGAS